MFSGMTLYFRSMIRVHDIQKQMELTASFDFPDSGRRRIVKAKSEFR
jgi:hypothetical protein